MHYYEVAPNKIIRSNNSVFTYSYERPLATGTIVEIEVGKKSLIGIVIQKVKQPPFSTKKIVRLIEPQPLPLQLVKTALWMSSYYATPLAITLQTILPRGITKTRRNRLEDAYTPFRNRTKVLLNQEQQAAMQTIKSIASGSVILHGVTGSGKTQIYIELARQGLSQGKSTIILVPEIALTPQLIDEFSYHFKNVVLTHSRQTEAERHVLWKLILNSAEPYIIIGPRSALFLPVQSLGYIIVDEAHEPSFKQEQSPRYSALRAASILGSNHDAKVIFGSATPLISEYFLAEQTSRPIIRMANQARPNTIKPVIKLVDMTNQHNFKKHRFLSDILISKIETTVRMGHQVMLFHNRRGSASTTLCENCGWIALCPNCFIPYTLHADRHILRCHVCDSVQKVPTHCPVCKAVDIVFKGIGTKLIEAEAKQLFPNKKIVRFDADTTTNESLESRYQELYEGSIDIIIGTQVIAKGLDLPNLRTVGVIQADAGLILPDYSSSERTFQLLAQVIGRVGRSHHPTDVIVQSYQPQHPAVIHGLSQNYQQFYKTTLMQRKAGNFPPFTYLLKLTCLYKTEATAIKNTRQLATSLRQSSPSHIQILGPTPAFYEQQAGTYRWQLIIKSPKRSDLLELLKKLPSTHWQFELDPNTLL